METPVLAPNAIPTSEIASTGALFTPSPTMATDLPPDWKRFTAGAFFAGENLSRDFVDWPGNEFRKLRTQDASRRCDNGRDAQRNGAHHRRDYRWLQLHAGIRTKTASTFWLTGSDLYGYRLATFKHLLYLLPDSRFQYRNANQLPMSRGPALISRHLILRHPATSDGAPQQECLPFRRCRSFASRCT